MPDAVRVTVKGVDELVRRLGEDNIAKALKPALTRAGLRVQAKAQKAVHSDRNPFIGKAGYNVATGKLSASIGTSDVRGQGIALEVAVGTPYGKGGLAGATFARSAARTVRGNPGSSRTRTGGRKNKSDVAVYAPIEERRHPFLVPSLEGSADDIARDLASGVDAALGGKP